jgi:predicted methyltransferase
MVLAALLVVLGPGCGGSPPPPAEAAHGHDHHDHDPHRFEHADEWAKKFDDPSRDAWQRPADVIEAMKLGSGMAVADIGAGTGYFEPWLSRAVGPSGTVLALDVEADMVRYLGDRAAREHLANVRPARVPTADPKLPAGGMDRILVVDTWHHVPAREAYAAKLRDGLKPGGQVFIVDFKLDAKQGPPPHHRLSPDQVARELEAGGLHAEPAATQLPEQYIVIGTR